MADVRKHITFYGRVQGVGFRYTAKYLAQSMDLTGWVENEDDGTVTLEVQGDPALFAQMFDRIAAGGYIQITGIQSRDIPPDPWARGFSVRGY